MSRQPLTDTDLAAIAGAPPETTAAHLARQLGRPYFTVAKAVQRIRRDGWACQLDWRSCDVCGGPLASPVAPGRRTVHTYCERERIVRRARERRQRLPGQSTPYVRAYRQTQAGHERHLVESRAWAKRRWQQAPPEERDALLDKVHLYDADAQAETAERANQSGAAWTAEEDAYVLDQLRTPAREVALVLGRSLYAVKGRRVILRRRGGEE